MHYITFFIQHNNVTGFVAQMKAGQAILIMQEDRQITTMHDSCACVAMLLQQFSLVIDAKQLKKAIYRIVLANDRVMQHYLPLPNVDLTVRDIQLYIENILAKIFQTTVPLSYDYLSDEENNQHSQLIVYAYQYPLIKQYIDLFASTKLNFIGITASIASQTTVIPVSAFASLAILPNIDGINFLPWREQQQSARRKRFITVIAGCLVIYFAALWLLIGQLHQRVDKQHLLYQQYSAQLAEKTQQLTSLIDLNATRVTLQANIARQVSLKQQLVMLADYLILIASAVPEGIWLSSLSYQSNKFTLRGESFLYADILALSHQLTLHDITQQHQIVSVKQQDYLLQFSLDMQSKYWVTADDD